MRILHIHNWFTRLGADRRGASLLEMTFITPMLIFLALGIVEFGRAFQQHHIMNKAMRDAARYLARVPVSCPAGSATGSVTNSADVTTAKNLALNDAPTGGSPRVSYWTNPASITVQVDCFDNTAGAYRGEPEIPLITVSAAVPYQDLGFIGVLGAAAWTFHVRHQEIHIGE